LELGDPLIFSGDAQHDSRRGATYATYPINCRNNNKIIAIEVITKSMTGASSKMETLGAETVLIGAGSSRGGAARERASSTPRGKYFKAS